MCASLKMAKIPSADKPTPWKKGTRVLGVSESFVKTDEKSIVVGVVMRGDMRIDGFGVCQPTVGGLDSTDKLIEMFENMKRMDIRSWLLGGSMVSWFNMINIEHLHNRTSIPVVCVTYNPSEGVEQYVKEYFPEDWKVRMQMVEETGERIKIMLKNEHEIFINHSGVSVKEATQLVELFTLDGRIPEPIRIARLLAQSIRRDLSF